MSEYAATYNGNPRLRPVEIFPIVYQDLSDTAAQCWDSAKTRPAARLIGIQYWIYINLLLGSRYTLEFHREGRSAPARSRFTTRPTFTEFAIEWSIFTGP